jgi:hypothetical protein
MFYSFRLFAFHLDVLLEIVPAQVMILYEDNALEVGVTSWLVCCCSRRQNVRWSSNYIHPTNPALA